MTTEKNLENVGKWFGSPLYYVLVIGVIVLALGMSYLFHRKRTMAFLYLTVGLGVVFLVSGMALWMYYQQLIRDYETMITGLNVLGNAPPEIIQQMVKEAKESIDAAIGNRMKFFASLLLVLAPLTIGGNLWMHGTRSQGSNPSQSQ